MASSLQPQDRLTILTVASEKELPRFLQDLLLPFGYEVRHFTSVEEAVEVAITEKPGAIFAQLPMTGYQDHDAESAACLSLCSVARPVFLVGPKQDPAASIRAFETGCAEYLVMPLDAGEILAKLRHPISSKAAKQNQAIRVGQTVLHDPTSPHSIAGVTHDLGNLFLSIRGLGELLASRPILESDPRAREIVETILSASSHGLKRVKTTLKHAAMERSSTTLTKRQHRISELLREAVQNLAGWGARKGLQLKLMKVDPDMVWLCDRENLIRAIENLVNNAVKFSPSGSTVEVEAKITDQGLMIAVRDQGPGFSPDDHEAFFTAFKKASASPTGSEESTGLGLAICREIVVAHRGRIDCRNLSPNGSEFVINLPPIGKDAA